MEKVTLQEWAHLLEACRLQACLSSLTRSLPRNVCMGIQINKQRFFQNNSPIRCETIRAKYTLWSNLETHPLVENKDSETMVVGLGGSRRVGLPFLK